MDGIGEIAASPVVTVLSDRQRAHPIVPRHGRTIPSSQSGDLVRAISTAYDGGMMDLPFSRGPI